MLPLTFFLHTYITRRVSDIWLTSETFKVTNYAYFTENAVTSEGQDLSYLESDSFPSHKPVTGQLTPIYIFTADVFKIYFKTDFLRT